MKKENNAKKQFETPKFTIISFVEEDIITASGEIDEIGANGWEGDFL